MWWCIVWFTHILPLLLQHIWIWIMDMYVECTAMCAQSWLTVMYMYMYMWIVQCAVLKVGWGDLSADVQCTMSIGHCPIYDEQCTIYGCILYRLYNVHLSNNGVRRSKLAGVIYRPLGKLLSAYSLPSTSSSSSSFLHFKTVISQLNIFHVQRTNQTRVTMIGSFSTCSIAEKSSTLSTAVKMHEMTACLTFEVFFRYVCL